MVTHIYIAAFFLCIDPAKRPIQQARSRPAIKGMLICNADYKQTVHPIRQTHTCCGAGPQARDCAPCEMGLVHAAATKHKGRYFTASGDRQCTHCVAPNRTSEAPASQLCWPWVADHAGAYIWLGRLAASSTDACMCLAQAQRVGHRYPV